MTTRSLKVARSRAVDRRWFLHHAGLLIPFILATAPARGAERAGAVDDVKGEAFADAAGARRALAQAAPVFLGDQVGTGLESRLAMRLGRDTTIRLGANARLTIDRFLAGAGGEMTLQSGALLFDRPAGSPRAAVQIRSQFALIAVRGTRFFAGPSNGPFGIFVGHGVVTVTAGGQQLVLHSGEGTDFFAPGSAPTPVKRWQPPRIRAALASVG
jgi:hypothetical protein